MSETVNKELDRSEQTEQTCSAIAMLNRLSVAKIRLKRADRLSDTFGKEMKEINDSITSLTDSLVLGEDVRADLKIIDGRVTKFEQRIAL